MGPTEFGRRCVSALAPNSPHDRQLGSAVIARAVVLLGLLLVVKLMVIGSLPEHLFQTHWRLPRKPSGTLEFASFWGFVVLLGVIFITLGVRARSFARDLFPWLNVAFVAISLPLALLTQSQFGRSYLAIYMTGGLSFADLRHYVVMDLFFAPPYLAAYLIGYVLAAWLCIRGNRGHWTFFLMGLSSVLYAVLNLQHLEFSGRTLAVANAMGLAGLICLITCRVPARWTALLPHVLALACCWILFAGQDASVATPSPYLVLILALTVSFFLPLYVGLRKRPEYLPLSFFLPFLVVAFFLLANGHYPRAYNYNALAVYSLTGLRYAVDELAVVMVLTLGVWWLVRRGLRQTLHVFDAAAVLLVVFAIADVLVLNKMGNRIDWNLLAMSDDITKTWGLIRPHLAPLLAGVLAVTLAYVCVLKWVTRTRWTRLAVAIQPHRGSLAFALTSLILVAGLAPVLVSRDNAQQLSVVRVAASSPWGKGWSVPRWEQGELVAHARAFSLPTGPSGGNPNERRSRGTNLNVVMIVMESSYNRYLSLFGGKDETQPLLGTYRDRMELFPNFFAPFPNSMHARFSIYNGLYPTVEYPSYVNPGISCPSLFEVLHDAGYATSLYYSSTRNYTRLNDYLGHRKIDVFHDCDTMPGREQHARVSWGIAETATLQAIKAQIDGYAQQGTRFFLSYIPAAPHQPFDTSAPQFNKFHEGSGPLDNNYLGRYKNQLLYMDWIIASIVQHLEEKGLLDETVVVITNDHGEMVGDEPGMLGHGWCLKPELSNTPLMVMDPRSPGARVNTTFGSHVDMLPTLLDLLGLPIPEGELYQGVSLYSEAARQQRPIYIQSYQDRALVHGGYYYWLPSFQAEQEQTLATLRKFKITNAGSATGFEELTTVDPPPFDFLGFERFQQSFVVHYDHYRAVRANWMATADTVHRSTPGMVSTVLHAK